MDLVAGRKSAHAVFGAGVGGEGGDEVRLDDDLAAGDVGDVGVALGEEVELRRAEEVVRLRGQRHADDEPVDVLREEVVQRGRVQAAVPRAGDGAVRVAGAGHDEAAVALALRGGAWGGGEGDDVHAHRFGDVGDLAADGAVAQHGEALADVVADGAEPGGLALLAPEVLGLPGVEGVVGVGGNEGGEEDPFGDLGAVDAGGGGEGDGGVLVDRCGLDMVRAGGEEVDELCCTASVGGRLEREERLTKIGAQGGRRGQGGQGNEDGGFAPEICSDMRKRCAYRLSLSARRSLDGQAPDHLVYQSPLRRRPGGINHGR